MTPEQAKRAVDERLRGRRAAEPAEPSRPTCKELGPVLRPTELKAYGFEIRSCGCLGKIRVCGLHDFCTTAEPYKETHCCETCNEHTEIGAE
jgi:hypothetical protein